MADYSWPVALPQIPQTSSYAGTYDDSVLRTKMDTGPDKLRNRYTAVPEFLDCTFLLNPTQRELFRTFYEQTISYGAVRFDWVHPETLQPVECRIFGKPKRSFRGVTCILSLRIEVLP